MISRRRTREYLLQMLYARACTPTTFDRDIFFDAYFEEKDSESLDQKYLSELESKIMKHETELLGIIGLLAPKFELSTLPTIHLLILMVSLTEMLYAKLSVNEAIELAKRFSDDQGKGFINGALSTFLKEREKLVSEKKVEGTFHIFSQPIS
jgi:transcription antitermination protein NusB